MDACSARAEEAQPPASPRGSGKTPTAQNRTAPGSRFTGNGVTLLRGSPGGAGSPRCRQGQREPGIRRYSQRDGAKAGRREREPALPRGGSLFIGDGIKESIPPFTSN